MEQGQIILAEGSAAAREEALKRVSRIIDSCCSTCEPMSNGMITLRYEEAAFLRSGLPEWAEGGVAFLFPDPADALYFSGIRSIWH